MMFSQLFVVARSPVALAAPTTFIDINPDATANTDPDASAGGRVNGVATSADDDRVFYAATEWGGVAKTIDGGLNWNRLDKHLPVATWDVAVDPGNTGTVYATSFFDGREASLSGINISRDGGATWARPATATPPGALGCGADRVDEPSAFGVGIRPDAPANVFVGTNCGVARSTDSGTTWSFVDPDPVGAPGNVWDVVVQAADATNTLGIVDVCGDAGHFRSVDLGANWTSGTGLPTGRCSIAASPDENYVLLVLASDNRLYESDDGGTNWTNLGFPDPRAGGRIPFVVANQRAGATFDIWSGGVSLYRAACTSAAAPGGAPRCPAGYTTPPVPNTSNPNPPWAGPFTRTVGAHDDIGDIEFDSQPAAGADACPIMFSSDGGMYRNTDGGADCHNPNWTQANTGLHDTWLWAMAGANKAGDSAEDLYFGLQDSGSWASTNAGAATPTWSNPDCCDIFDIAAEPDRVLYTFCCAGAGGRRTTANLANPGMTGGAQINTYPAGGLLPGFNFPDILENWGDRRYVMLTVDCTNPANDGIDNNNDTVIDNEASNGCPPVNPGGSSDGGVFVTNDITVNPIVWTELGNASEPNSTQYCDVQTSTPASEPNNPTFYVGIGNCRGEASSQYFKYTGTAPGGTWDRIDDNPGTQAGGFGIFAADPKDPNRLYASNLAAAGPRMVFSLDGGATWQPDTELDALMTGNGTFEYQNQRGPTQFTGFGGYTQPSLVAFDPENPKVLVAGGRDSGVFFSTDSGDTWSLLTDPIDSGSSGVPHLPRPWFAYFDHEPAEKTNVYLGTQGRGVWRLALPTTDLSITKSDSPDPVNAGDDLTYTIRVTNNGTEEAENVTVVDQLPAQTTFKTSSPDVCVEAPPDTLTCPLGDLPAGQTVELQILAGVDPDIVSDPPEGEKSITNTASVRSGSIDPDETNNVVSASTVVRDAADLRVSKVSDPDNTVNAGESFTWKVLVDNLGPSDARDVVLTDTILSDTSNFTMGAPSTDHGSCSTTSTSTFSCDLGVIPVGDRATITVQVTSEEGGTFQDEAVVTSDTPDPDTTNNRAVDFISVTAVADLSLTKDDSPDPVVAGENLTYTITATNDGPSTSEDVVISDFLPAGVSIVSVSGTLALSCNAGVPGDSSRPTTCNYGSLPDGAVRSMTIVVIVHPDTLGLIHNDAEVTSDTVDLDAADNKATEDTTVTAEADLVIQKTDSPDPVQAGRKLTYQLKVFNEGPSTAVAVSVEDLLPDEVDFNKVTISNGTGICVLQDVHPAPPTKKLTCELGNMGPNVSSPVLIHIDVIVKSETQHNTDITNVANVSSSTPEPDPDNGDNTSSATTTVIGIADLAMLKTSDKDHYRPSETIKYTLTATNNGPSDAVNVVVTDNLPTTKQALYQFDTAGCTKADLTLTCNLGTIEAGNSKSFNVYLIVRGRKDQVTNSASVQDVGATTDPNPTNNISTRVVLIKNI